MMVGQNTALLVVDIINDFNFEGGSKLLSRALLMVPRLASLKSRAKHAGIPVIYANDPFGHTDYQKLLNYCLEAETSGRSIVKQIAPKKDDCLILKPKHSALFQTDLETILHSQNVNTVILTGIAGDICVLFTANDAHMRDFNVIVASDCIISENPEQNRQAIKLMQRALKAKVVSSDELEFGDTSHPFEDVIP
jgi:nicotinamidase-related amidase